MCVLLEKGTREVIQNHYVFAHFFLFENYTFNYTLIPKPSSVNLWNRFSWILPLSLFLCLLELCTENYQINVFSSR